MLRPSSSTLPLSLRLWSSELLFHYWTGRNRTSAHDVGIARVRVPDQSSLVPMSSSWAAFLPTNIAKHPGNFVGPNVAGTIVQAFETGILVNQASRFWSGASEERTCTKLLVSFVSLAAWYVLYTGWRGLILITMNFSFQTCIAFYNTWRLIVLGFGEWVNWGFITLDYRSYLVILFRGMLSFYNGRIESSQSW